MQRSEQDWLVDNRPPECAQLVPSGGINAYAKEQRNIAWSVNGIEAIQPTGHLIGGLYV